MIRLRILLVLLLASLEKTNLNVADAHLRFVSGIAVGNGGQPFVEGDQKLVSLVRLGVAASFAEADIKLCLSEPAFVGGENMRNVFTTLAIVSCFVTLVATSNDSSVAIIVVAAGTFGNSCKELTKIDGGFCGNFLGLNVCEMLYSLEVEGLWTDVNEYTAVVDVLSANNDDPDGCEVSTTISFFPDELKLSDGKVVMIR